MRRLMPFLLFALGALVAPALAQEAPTPPPMDLTPVPRAQAAAAAAAAQQLQVDVVIERHRGERLVGRLPYRLLPIAAEGPQPGSSDVKTGIEVPIPAESGGGFRNVGTTVSCRVHPVRANVYWLTLVLQSNGVYPAGGGGDAAAADAGRPLLNSLNVNSSVLLRDGQTLQMLSSTSPVNGEVTTVDVTLKVLK